MVMAYPDTQVRRVVQDVCCYCGTGRGYPEASKGNSEQHRRVWQHFFGALEASLGFSLK